MGFGIKTTTIRIVFTVEFEVYIGINILVFTVVINQPHTIVGGGLKVIDSETIIRISPLIVVKHVFNG